MGRPKLSECLKTRNTITNDFVFGSDAFTKICGFAPYARFPVLNFDFFLRVLGHTLTPSTTIPTTLILCRSRRLHRGVTTRAIFPQA